MNVHFAFYHDESAAQQDVYILFVPRWRHGEAISGLNSIIRPEGGQRVKFVDTTTTGTAGPPTQRDAVFGRLSTEWSRYWFNYFRTSLLTTGPTQYNDWFDGVRRAPAMLSFFSLLPPMLNDNTGVTGLPDASILLRQGARELDISPAVLAGRLVIIAEAESSPLPVPLTVDGDPITGTGRTIYQLVLPLDRTPLEQAKAQRRAEEQSAATQPEPVPEEQAGQQQQG